MLLNQPNKNHIISFQGHNITRSENGLDCNVIVN